VGHGFHLAPGLNYVVHPGSGLTGRVRENVIEVPPRGQILSLGWGHLTVCLGQQGTNNRDETELSHGLVIAASNRLVGHE